MCVRIVVSVHEPRRRGIGMSRRRVRRFAPTIPTYARRPPRAPRVSTRHQPFSTSRHRTAVSHPLALEPR